MCFVDLHVVVATVLTSYAQWSASCNITQKEAPTLSNANAHGSITNKQFNSNPAPYLFVLWYIRRAAACASSPMLTCETACPQACYSIKVDQRFVCIDGWLFGWLAVMCWFAEWSAGSYVSELICVWVCFFGLLVCRLALVGLIIGI